MKFRLLFILIASFTFVVSATAQSRTITNEDLEKFRQKRLAAEKDLRENYERLGFPSPEELEKQIEQSRADRAALSARLEAENLQREQLNIERRRAEIETRSLNYQTQQQNSPQYTNDYYNSPYNGFLSFPNFGYRNNRYNRRGNFNRGFNRGFDNQPRYEYRNNLPVRIPPPAAPIFSPR